MTENAQELVASIAILDDDADFRTYLEDFLKDEGSYSVRAFGNARTTCLRAARRACPTSCCWT